MCSLVVKSLCERQTAAIRGVANARSQEYSLQQRATRNAPAQNVSAERRCFVMDAVQCWYDRPLLSGGTVVAFAVASEGPL